MRIRVCSDALTSKLKSERGGLLSVEMSADGGQGHCESDFAICLVLTCCPMSARAVSVTINGLVT